MKKLKYVLLSAVALMLFAACHSDGDKATWEKYADWRNLNISWIEEMENLEVDGEKVYTKVVPAWNTNAYVLMRWFNDRTATEGNLTPYYTSYVDVKYYGQLYNDQPFDSSYTSITPADSVIRFQVKNTILGWGVAMEQMHVGDTVEVIIPYELAYGSSSMGAYIKPYSALKFGIKLTNVAGEVIRPE